MFTEGSADCLPVGQLSFTLAPHFFNDLGNVALQQPLVAGGKKKKETNPPVTRKQMSSYALHQAFTCPGLLAHPLNLRSPLAKAEKSLVRQLKKRCI